MTTITPLINQNCYKKYDREKSAETAYLSYEPSEKEYSGDKKNKRGTINTS